MIVRLKFIVEIRQLLEDGKTGISTDWEMTKKSLWTKFMLYIVYCMLYVVWLYVVCCMLYVVCCMFFLCKSPLTRLKSHCSVRGYKLLLQQKLIDPPLECCEIVICWKAFIGEGVPNGCGSCCMLYVVCCMLYVVCCMLYVVCCMLYVVCCMLYVVCCMLYVVCCMLYVVCCMLYVVCCMLYVVCCMLYVVCCICNLFHVSYFS